MALEYIIRLEDTAHSKGFILGLIIKYSRPQQGPRGDSLGLYLCYYRNMDMPENKSTRELSPIHSEHTYIYTHLIMTET